ncbi:MAG: hypothetical protein J1D87_10170 [Lachnospiraceae bacterium]|nr:hypothetical protein [Lachnospiraceae bacterium]
MGKNWKKKIDATLFDVCLGIFLYGIVCQIVLLFFTRAVQDILGLWIGILLGILGSIHIWWSIDRGLDMASKDAMKTVGTNWIIRYFVLILTVGLLWFSKLANPFLTILGYMGMKAGAYMQPFTRKISFKLFKI